MWAKLLKINLRTTKFGKCYFIHIQGLKSHFVF